MRFLKFRNRWVHRISRPYFSTLLSTMSSFRRRQERDNTDDIELHDVTHSSRPRDMESIVSENSDLLHQNQPIQIHDNNQHNLSSDNQKKPKNGKPWYLFLDHSALILENKGSVARDHVCISKPQLQIIPYQTIICDRVDIDTNLLDGQ